MIHYIVMPGDTLVGVARLYGTTMTAIVRANPFLTNPDLIYPGMVLHVPIVEPPAEEPPAEEPPAEEPPAEEPASGDTIWVDVSALPMSGDAWERIRADAYSDWGTADISNQDQSHDVKVLAGAMVYARNHDPSLRAKVVDGLLSAVGTETGGRTLALARNLTGYVLAADYIDYREPAFVQWVSDVRTKELDGRTLISTHEDRPNNWGTHAGVARVVASLYVGDLADVNRAATVFRGFLGDRSAYAGFAYGELSWQADPSNPVGINPLGATINGRDVDGVIPDDQRRTGSFSWPAPKGSYPWEAFQGIVTMAEILSRHGYPDVWGWSDSAVLRAFEWLWLVNENPASGDDSFVIPIVNARYHTGFPVGVVGFGKSVGYTDWTHSN